MVGYPAASQDVDRAVRAIRADFGTVQEQVASWDSTIKPWMGAGGEGLVVRWIAPDGRFTKLVIRFDGDGASRTLELFFRRDDLFFAFDQWVGYAPDGGRDVVEQRYYFDRGTLVRWLARTSADGPNVPQDPGDAEFLTAERRMPAVARCWTRFLGAAEADWDVWGADTGCGNFW